MLSSPGARVPLYADGQWLGKQDLLTNRQQCEATQQLVLVHPRLVTLAQDQQTFVGNGGVCVWAGEVFRWQKVTCEDL